MLVNGNPNHASRRQRPRRAIARRGILIGAAMAVTAIAATGCGSDSNDRILLLENPGRHTELVGSSKVVPGSRIFTAGWRG